MSKKIKSLEALLMKIRCSETANALKELIDQADKEQQTNIDFLENVLKYEVQKREEKALERRLKLANFPYYRSLDEFDLQEQPSLTTKNFNKLKELVWIDQLYNLVFLGPTGTGKTFLSIGLGIKAVNEGYKVGFVTMGEMVELLKTMSYLARSSSRVKRLKQADLLILDDLMFMAMDKEEANLFFHFINEIYENTSIILTSNKSPNDWGQLIGDEIITGAILDRIIQKSEIIQLSGDSYRLRHREALFSEEQKVAQS